MSIKLEAGYQAIHLPAVSPLLAEAHAFVRDLVRAEAEEEVVSRGECWRNIFFVKNISHLDFVVNARGAYMEFDELLDHIRNGEEKDVTLRSDSAAGIGDDNKRKLRLTVVLEHGDAQLDLEFCYPDKETPIDVQSVARQLIKLKAESSSGDTRKLKLNTGAEQDIAKIDWASAPVEELSFDPQYVAHRTHIAFDAITANRDTLYISPDFITDFDEKTITVRPHTGASGIRALNAAMHAVMELLPNYPDFEPRPSELFNRFQPLGG
jgi:hypothetical protein